MVEQQIVKSYKLLSSSSVNFFANDPKLEEMWYIVSCFLFEFFFLCVSVLEVLAGHIWLWIQQ